LPWIGWGALKSVILAIALSHTALVAIVRMKLCSIASATKEQPQYKYQYNYSARVNSEYHFALSNKMIDITSLNGINQQAYKNLKSKIQPGY